MITDTATSPEAGGTSASHLGTPLVLVHLEREQARL